MIKDNLSIHNKFEFEVIDVRTNKVRQQAVAYNVICNGFWDRCTTRLTSTYSSGEWNSGIVYGDGTGTPAENDTALFNKRGYKAYTGSAEMISDNRVTGVLAARRKAVINPEEAVNIDISEIGMSESGNALLTHAMLQDMNGNTIVIHKTDTDLINVYATVYLHWNPDEVYLQNDVYINTYAYGTIFRLFGFGGWGGSMSGNGGELGARLLKAGRPYYDGNFPTANLPNSAGCTLRSKGYKWNKERLDADSGNETGGYRYIVMAYGENTSLAFDIAKITDPSEITQEAVATGDGTIRKFGTLFDFPYNAKVYVNGALKASGVTVRKHPGKRFHFLADYVDLLAGNSTYAKQVPIFPRFNLYWHPFYAASDNYYYTESGLFRNVANELGITHIQKRAATSTLQVSNDLVDWVDLTPANTSKTAVAAEYQNYKFYKINNMTIFPAAYDGCNIEFDVAPAEGDVITIDYTTDVLAKDADHVYDFEFDLSFDNLLS